MPKNWPGSTNNCATIAGFSNDNHGVNTMGAPVKKPPEFEPARYNRDGTPAKQPSDES